MSETRPPQGIAAWLAARAVIGTWLRDLLPRLDHEHAERYAEALLARLAAHAPPILLSLGTTPDAGEGEA